MHDQVGRNPEQRGLGFRSCIDQSYVDGRNRPVAREQPYADQRMQCARVFLAKLATARVFLVCSSPVILAASSTTSARRLTPARPQD